MKDEQSVYVLREVTLTLEQWIGKQPLNSTIKILDGDMLYNKATNEFYLMGDSND